MFDAAAGGRRLTIMLAGIVETQEYYFSRPTVPVVDPRLYLTTRLALLAFPDGKDARDDMPPMLFGLRRLLPAAPAPALDDGKPFSSRERCSPSIRTNQSSCVSATVD